MMDHGAWRPHDGSFIVQAIISRRAHDTVAISEAHAWYAEMLLLSGQVSQALVWAEKALSRLRLGGSTAAARAHRVRAIAKSNRQDTDWSSIQSEMEESLTVATSQKCEPEAAITHFRYAELLHARDAFNQARVHVVAASERFAAMNMTWWTEQAAKLRTRLRN
jgi:hypothetical protein